MSTTLQTLDMFKPGTKFIYRGNLYTVLNCLVDGTEVAVFTTCYTTLVFNVNNLPETF